MLRIYGNKFKHLAGLSYAGLAGSSAAFLLILAVMLFAPAASQPEASAVEDNSGISTYAATPTVGISLPISIDFADVLPTPSGATTTATADLTITTTDSAGYNLYLYSSDGDNSLRPKNSSLANISQINATAGDVGLTLSSLEPNTWGYSLGTSEPTADTTYNAVPTSNDTPIQTKDTSSTASANDTYTLSFGAKVDTSIPSGTYTGTLTVAVVAEPALVTIAFDGNGATGGSMPSQQIAAGQSANLNTNQYTRDGYDFTGWNTNAGGTGTSYADGASYTAPSSSAGQMVTLYAQWQASIPPAPTGYMQDFTLQQCQYYANANNYILTDRRDNNTYTVRYINGVCWMTQNLRLSSGSTLTSSDSNVESTWHFPITELSSGGSYTDARSHNSGRNDYGYWYNFCAASAGTVCQNNYAQNATYDICPKGWRLPVYDELYSGNASVSSSYAAAFSPVLGGWFNYTTNSSLDTGVWWSSSGHYSNAESYHGVMSYNQHGFGVGYFNSRMGLYVRCVLSS